MALSRDDHVKLKIEELENLKQAMRGYNGERLAKLKAKAAEPADAGDEDGAAGDDSGAEDAATVEQVACPECGKENDAGAMVCKSCGRELEQEGGGEEGGDADSDEESETAEHEEEVKSEPWRRR